MTKKVLFLNYQAGIKKEVSDPQEFYLNKSSFKSLYQKLFFDIGVVADFKSCRDLYTIGNKFFMDDKELSETYQSVFLGLIAKDSEISLQLIKYLSINKINTIHYGRLDIFDTKYFEYAVLKNSHLHSFVLPFVTFANVTEDVIDKISYTVGLPFVFKVPNVNRCRGVKKIKSVNGLIRHVETFDKKGKFFERKGEKIYYKDPFIAQRIVHKNSEFRAIVYDNCLSKNSILYAVTNERLLYYHGEVQQRYQMSDVEIDLVQQVSVVISKELKKLYGISDNETSSFIFGLDIIKDSTTGNLYVLEVNSAPQYLDSSLVANYNFPEFLVNKMSPKF